MPKTAGESQAGYELFAHGADIGVRGHGPTKDEALAQAARALTAAVTDPARVDARSAVAIACEAPNDVTLLVDWLNALIFEMSVRKMLFVRFEVSIEGKAGEGGLLSATAWGEAVDRARHEPAAEPKGATYTEARVGRDASGAWTAQCVVDV